MNSTQYRVLADLYDAHGSLVTAARLNRTGTWRALAPGLRRKWTPRKVRRARIVAALQGWDA